MEEYKRQKLTYSNVRFTEQTSFLLSNLLQPQEYIWVHRVSEGAYGPDSIVDDPEYIEKSDSAAKLDSKSPKRRLADSQVGFQFLV